VPSRFFRCLLARCDPLPRDFAGAITELDELGSTRPSLAASAALLRDLLPILAENEPPAAPALTPESAIGGCWQPG
jgi:hypothetical protein